MQDLMNLRGQVGALWENWRFMEWTDHKIKNVFKFPKAWENF